MVFDWFNLRRKCDFNIFRWNEFDLFSIIYYFRFNKGSSMNLISSNIDNSILSFICIFCWSGNRIFTYNFVFKFDILWNKLFTFVNDCWNYFNSLSCWFNDMFINISWFTNYSFSNDFWFRCDSLNYYFWFLGNVLYLHLSFLLISIIIVLICLNVYREDTLGY